MFACVSGFLFLDVCSLLSLVCPLMGHVFSLHSKVSDGHGVSYRVLLHHCGLFFISLSFGADKIIVELPMVQTSSFYFNAASSRV
jgi:hypothetical protein